MNQNHPFVLEMAFRLVALHRAGESKKALWLRKQRQAMTIDDDQLKDALAVIYRLPDQSAEAMEDWVRTRYLEDGLEKGYAQEGTEDPLWLLAAKAHTHYGDLKQAS
ncbi:hypothetical protein RHA1_ro09105 (plasmid) [Rhodococcus jostii RHA1]|uniref:Uncharacterized protein n=1 Tax=Rhodococcus jostii (strain RHA1) TaxID=101510 RepID=Q0RX38_RHOJR|nr:hypothetical protein [Rhodococcus jostii]ABH00148.1 hypothetical protein RHA1_ro09105 [Rhodococcus jostii RHA1]